MHDGYYTDDLEALLHGPVNAYGVTKGILEHLKVPYAIAFGNHDVRLAVATMLVLGWCG